MYLIIDNTNNTACVIDPGEAKPIIDYIEKKEIDLQMIDAYQEGMIALDEQDGLTAAKKFSEAELFFGVITNLTPAASAVLRQAPKLCGSVTESKTSKSSDFLLPTLSMSSAAETIPRGAAELLFTKAATPWCVPCT